jgi:hypothetical protein
MGKIRFAVLSLAVLGTAICDRAHAAIEAYANLNIFGFELMEDTDNDMVGDTPITAGDQITVTGASFSSSATADVASVPLSAFTNVNNAPTASVGHDTLQAFNGAGAAPAENTFGNFAGVNPFARGDTDGSGSIIAGLAEATPAMASAVSEVDLLATMPDAGTASSGASSNGSFSVDFTPGSDLVIVGEFMASRSLLAELIPAALGSTAGADTSFTISLRVVGGAEIFNWSPNGQTAGTMVGDALILTDPFDINGSISAFPGSSSSVDVGPGLFSALFTLQGGVNYSFNISMQTQADATVVPVVSDVPEMSGIVVWGVLALVGGGAARFRSSKILK